MATSSIPRSRQLKDEVDETLIAAQLRMTPAQRLAAFESDYRQFREFAKKSLGRAGAAT